MTFKEELTDFIYRYIMTCVIGLFLVLEIYNFYDAEFISRKNIFILLAVSLCFNTLVILYNKIHLYIFPAILLVITFFSFVIDEEDLALLLESSIFKLVIIGFGAFILFLISEVSFAFICYPPYFFQTNFQVFAAGRRFAHRTAA